MSAAMAYDLPPHRPPALIRELHSYSVSGNDLEQNLIELRESLESTVTFCAESDLLTTLENVARNCVVENWDGEGAAAISFASLNTTLEFIQSLPNRIPEPEVSPDPVGGISLEWIMSPQNRIVVLIQNEKITFASMSESERFFGESPFNGEVPSVILGLLDRLAA